MAETWLTSDPHWFHDNIIQHCGRPFKSHKDMNEFMIEQWNTFVKPQDSVYCLGDWTMFRGGRQQRETISKLTRSLNGHKRLLLGNHDHFPVEVYINDMGFEKIRGTGQWLDRMILSHYPIHPNSMAFSAVACVHGHIHQNPSPDPVIGLDKNNRVIVKPYVNVCVEQTNYHPITLGEVKDKVRAIKEAHE